MVDSNPTFQYYEITVGNDTRSIKPVKNLYHLEGEILRLWPEIKNTKLKITYADSIGDKVNID